MACIAHRSLLRYLHNVRKGLQAFEYSRRFRRLIEGKGDLEGAGTDRRCLSMGSSTEHVSV
jgi:hypothetical protein